MFSANQLTRTATIYTIIFLFLLSLLWSGISNRPKVLTFKLPEKLYQFGFKGYPDFRQYVPLRTIDELDLDHRRLVIVGDIHGMKSSIDTLLWKVSYSSASDLLIHLGDTIAKGPNSSQVLSQFSETNVTGIRGNHEQKVIEWRGWIEFVEGQRGGKEWLARLERTALLQGVDTWAKRLNHGGLKWPIPRGWKFMAEHYAIARSLTPSQYSYLKSLPLVIHLPSLHTHLVHAGMLPFNPKYPPTSSNQPLAHIPLPLLPLPPTPMRTAQERALLTDIVQNTDPWVLLNMRSVLRNNEVSRKSKQGTPWSDLWDMIMKRCEGYHDHRTWRGNDSNTDTFKLPCLPINVIYGHAAARGLDIKRWSFGLDTGCVSGNLLTAMIIPKPSTDMVVDEPLTRNISFGDDSRAQLFSVPCSKP